MKKISDYIKYFEDATVYDQVDAYFSDQYTLRKVSDLKIMLSAIGDVEMSYDYIKVFLYMLSKESYKTPYKDVQQKIKLIYGLSKDKNLSKSDLQDLFIFYHKGAYRLMYDDIEMLLGCDDLSSKLRDIVAEGVKYGEEEAEKLESLKDTYSPDFIRRVQSVVKEQLLSSEDVISMIPSSQFIRSSSLYIPLGYTINAAEDLVIKRLCRIDIEEAYQHTSAEDKIWIGHCSSGELVYTPFTKGMYEEDLALKRTRG